MGPDDFDAFEDIMTGLAEEYGTKLSAEGMALKYKALCEFSIEQVEVAAIHIMRTRVFSSFPPTGAFIKAIEGTQEDKAMVQWANVEEALKYHTRKAVMFDDPVTIAVVKRHFSGLRAMAESTEPKEWVRNGFLKAYAAYAAEGVQDYELLQGDPIGRYLCDDGEMKFLTVHVGDHEKARTLYLEGKKQDRERRIENPHVLKLVAGIGG